MLAKLESPQKAAESILKDFGIDPEKKGADDGKYYNTFANRDEEYYRNINDAVSGMTKRRTKERSAGMVALVVTAAVITSPNYWLTLLLLLISLALAAAAMAVGIALASVAVMASLLITGVVLIGAGISLIFGADPAVGIGLIWRRLSGPCNRNTGAASGGCRVRELFAVGSQRNLPSLQKAV